jgi:hypothetical protein
MIYTLQLLKRNKKNLEEKIRQHTILLRTLLNNKTKTQIIQELARYEKNLEELKYAIEVLEYDYETTV